jgi:UDP-N-acetylglucosamine transferase subunit ALG13
VRPLTILVTVGSDHHPFDRLVGWVDEWLEVHGSDPVTCVFQHGTAAPPRHGTRHAYLAHDELQRLLAQADVVVTQGGPMGIVESRRHGKKPIATPRLARLGEVVDDHQVTFCRQLASSGDLVIAEDAPALWAALDVALADPDAYLIESSGVDERVRRSVQNFSALVEMLPERHGLFPRRAGRQRRRQPS